VPVHAAIRWLAPCSVLMDCRLHSRTIRRTGSRRATGFASTSLNSTGAFSETKYQAGLLRLQQARPEAAAVYGVIDIPWAALIGPSATAYGGRRGPG
jgi:hypothetical protein